PGEREGVRQKKKIERKSGAKAVNSVCEWQRALGCNPSWFVQWVMSAPALCTRVSELPPVPLAHSLLLLMEMQQCTVDE
ncbi:hypothetical protein KUCAC02_006331, partial [Chaenocephalus aceratus]